MVRVWFIIVILNGYWCGDGSVFIVNWKLYFLFNFRVWIGFCCVVCELLFCDGKSGD